METRAYVAWAGDGLGRLTGRLELADDAEGLRRAATAAAAGAAVWASWALAAGGSVVEPGGAAGSVEVPAAALADAQTARARYSSAAGVTCSAGVGRRLSEAAKALVVAQEQGDQLVVYSREVGAKVAELAAQKQARERGGDGDADVAPPLPELPAVAKAEAPPPGGPAPVDHESAFHEVAGAADQADRAKRVDQSDHVQKLRESTAKVLEGLKAQLPALQQVRRAYPQAYAAVQQLVQATVGLARGLGEVHSRAQGAQTTKGELDPSDPGEGSDGELEKDQLDLPPHRRLDLPVGTEVNGEVKVQEATGRTAWKGVRAGKIAGQTPDEPLFGAHSHPVSSREPNSP